MAVALGLESLLEDEIAVGVEGNHDILVSQVCPDWEVDKVSYVHSLLRGYTLTET